MKLKERKKTGILNVQKPFVFKAFIVLKNQRIHALFPLEIRKYSIASSLQLVSKTSFIKEKTLLQYKWETSYCLPYNEISMRGSVRTAHIAR